MLASSPIRFSNSGGASSLPPTRSAPKKLGEVSRSDERGLIDLSAEELLKQIQAEKAELIKQGNNKWQSAKALFLTQKQKIAKI
jgi:hypothetical protein